MVTGDDVTVMMECINIIQSINQHWNTSPGVLGVVHIYTYTQELKVGFMYAEPHICGSYTNIA